ncbi:glucose-fructose oxidoreductase domain-containing protein 1 isoform X1 [Marmota monax]|nr:glucose-fructose oxidoreductase domain-containing protein 1 isoform X1 [Marmota monax]
MAASRSLLLGFWQVFILLYAEELDFPERVWAWPWVGLSTSRLSLWTLGAQLGIWSRPSSSLAVCPEETDSQGQARGNSPLEENPRGVPRIRPQASFSRELTRPEKGKMSGDGSPSCLYADVRTSLSLTSMPRKTHILHCDPVPEDPRNCIGKNVICDRTATPLDAFRMMSAAHYYPKLMSIMGNVLRFLPAFVRMKQLIEEGYVGELLVCEVQVHSGSLLGKKYNWSCDDLMGGGGLHSVGTYIIDLLTFLTGQKAVKVHGLLKTFVKQTDHIKGIRQITSDDFCTFQMVLEGGVCCTVTLNFNVPGEFKQDVTVVGSAGRLLAVGTDLYGQRNSAPEQELLLQDATPVSNSLLPEKAFSDIPSPYLRGTMKMMQAVRQAFQDQDDRRTWDGRPLTMAATFDDCLYALCVVDTIKRSSQTGEWQNIAIMTEEPELSPAYLISEAMRRSRMSLYC